MHRILIHGLVNLVNMGKRLAGLVSFGILSTSQPACLRLAKLFLACLCVFFTVLYYFSSTELLPVVVSTLKSDSRYRKYVFNDFKVDAVDCPMLFRGAPNSTLAKFRNLTTKHNIELDKFLKDARSVPDFCDKFKSQRRYVTEPLREEERNFGIAYTITIYKVRVCLVKVRFCF